MQEMRVLSPTGVLGSAGTAGADAHLDWTYGILKEIAAEEKLAFRPAATGRQVLFLRQCPGDQGLDPPSPQGDLGDADGHGRKRYAPLMEIEIP